MMNLQLTKNELGETAIWARDLHLALEVATPYKDWIRRMIAHGFEEGGDFSTSLSESTGGRPSQNHLLTLDMAKEVAMLAKTPMGKQIRKYFIEVEKKSRFQAVPTDPLSIMRTQMQVLEMVGAEVNTLKIGQVRLESQISELKNSEPLRPIECDEIQRTVNEKAVAVLGGKGSVAYKDNSIRQSVFSAIYRELKYQFEVHSYKAILRTELTVAKELVKKSVMPYRLQLEIEKVNGRAS